MTLYVVTGYRCLRCGARQHTRSPIPGRCCDDPFQLRVLLDVPDGEPLIPEGSNVPPADEVRRQLEEAQA